MGGLPPRPCISVFPEMKSYKNLYPKIYGFENLTHGLPPGARGPSGEKNPDDRTWYYCHRRGQGHQCPRRSRTGW